MRCQHHPLLLSPLPSDTHPLLKLWHVGPALTNTFYVEEGSIPQQIVSSLSTPDHVLVEDCSDKDDYDEDEVDYSNFGGSSKFFRSLVSSSTGKQLDVTLNSVSRVSPLCGSGKSALLVATPTKSIPSPVPVLQSNTPGLAMADPVLQTIVSSPADASHSGTSHSSALVEKWRDLFASNRNTISSPKLLHFSSSYSDLPCDLSFEDLDNNYDVWQLCIVGYVAGKSPGFKALSSIISSTWRCEASLAIHEYGLPLILKAMPEYFDFGTDEMSCVSIWVKFPNLPLKCWSPRCLSKIASKLGKPIQSD